jgi:hypothetical protein
MTVVTVRSCLLLGKSVAAITAFVSDSCIAAGRPKVFLTLGLYTCTAISFLLYSPCVVLVLVALVLQQG